MKAGVLFLLSKGCTNQQRIQTNRWCKLWEILEVACAGNIGVLTSVTGYRRYAPEWLFPLLDNCQIPLKGKFQWHWFFMTWRIIAAIQKGTPVLNCGTELSGQLVLLFSKNERWATEHFEILSHFLYIMELIHDTYKDLL